MPSAIDLQDPTSAAYKKAKRKFLKTAKNRPEHTDEDWTPFRAAEKKYKARFPPPDLSAVFDIAASDLERVEEHFPKLFIVPLGVLGLRDEQRKR